MAGTTTKEAIYWLLNDINAFASDAIDDLGRDDMTALRLQLNGLTNFIREEIERMEEVYPKIADSTDPRLAGGFITPTADDVQDGVK